jgi:formate dehydrogenase subunit delta
VSHEPSVIRMANDIARNQAHLSDAEAAAVLANHMRSFWDPRMRSQLRLLVETDPSSVGPVVAEAVAELARRP